MKRKKRPCLSYILLEKGVRPPGPACGNPSLRRLDPLFLCGFHCGLESGRRMPKSPWPSLRLGRRRTPLSSPGRPQTAQPALGRQPHPQAAGGPRDVPPALAGASSPRPGGHRTRGAKPAPPGRAAGGGCACLWRLLHPEVLRAPSSSMSPRVPSQDHPRSGAEDGSRGSSVVSVASRADAPGSLGPALCSGNRNQGPRAMSGALPRVAACLRVRGKAEHP